MDTEESIEIQKAINRGHPPTDEGPYYHEPWWESYKGGIKGYLGGAVAYAGVGAVIGIITAAALNIGGLVAATAILPIIAGCAAAGVLYGANEFNNIGHIVGSGAAIAEEQEERTNSKFEALEKKIDELKGMISDKKTTASQPIQTVPTPPLKHRTTHIGNHQDGPPVFWKVAAIGLVAGLAAGALIAFGGVAESLLGALGYAGAELGMAGNIGIISVMGLFGASFGINRDIFRRIFDKTDLLFRGLLTHSLGISRYKDVEKSKEKSENTPIVTVVYPTDMVDFPASDTHFRDKRKAELALMKLDPSKTIRQ